MKPVTPDPLLMQTARDGIVVGDRVVAAMKGGVEASDLRKSGEIDLQRADRRQVVGLMQRRKCREPLKTRDHAMVDQYRAIVIGTAMDDPMADSERSQPKLVPQPATRKHQRGRDIRHRLDRIGAVSEGVTTFVGRAQPRTTADPVQ